MLGQETLASKRLGQAMTDAPAAHTLRDVVCSALVHLNNAENNAATMEGKLYGYSNSPVPVATGKATEEPPIESLLLQLRDRLHCLEMKTEGMLARLCLAVLCVAGLAACTPTTYTKATTHADGSILVYEVDYQRDWWGIIGEPDMMGIKGERRKLILPDGSAVQEVNDTCQHFPVKQQVLYCVAK